MQLLKVAMLEDTKRDWKGRRSRPTMVTAGSKANLQYTVIHKDGLEEAERLRYECVTALLRISVSGSAVP